MLTQAHIQDASLAKQQILSAHHIVMHLHNSPDGDSIGANMAMAKILRSWKKPFSIYSKDPVPDNLDAFTQNELITFTSVDQATQEKFLHLAFDTSDWNHFVTDRHNISEDFKKQLRVVIDHHATNTAYGNTNIIAPEYSSTCELIMDLLPHWEVELNPDLANDLLLGIITDTGGFRWSSSQETFRKVATLMDAGADLDIVNFAVFRQIPFQLMELWQKLLANMQYDESRHMVITTLSHEELGDIDRNLISNELTQNTLINSIAHTDLGVFIREKSPGDFSVTLRGRTGNVNVGNIAKALGGGGHAMAAGSPIEDVNSIDEARAKVIEHIDHERTLNPRT